MLFAATAGRPFYRQREEVGEEHEEVRVARGLREARQEVGHERALCPKPRALPSSTVWAGSSMRP
jgi:hypothetical protein